MSLIITPRGIVKVLHSELVAVRKKGYNAATMIEELYDAIISALNAYEQYEESEDAEKELIIRRTEYKESDRDIGTNKE